MVRLCVERKKWSRLAGRYRLCSLLMLSITSLEVTQFLTGKNLALSLS